MKVKVISRDPQDYTRGKTVSGGGGVKAQTNLNTSVHPFQRDREYVRALNSVKIDKMFAKPFVGALSGHVDGVYTMARHPTRQACLISGGCDGEIRIWDVTSQKTTWKTRAFNGYVQGVTMDSTGNILLACGDSYVKMWGVKSDEMTTVNEEEEANTVLTCNQPLTSIDHKINSSVFATSAGNVVQLWDHSRSKPTQTFTWGNDTVTKVKFNPVESNIIASCAYDRSITLADSRQNTTLSKVILRMRSNALSWNPREPYIFTVANEDSNCYTFDMRNFHRYLLKHEDHLNAVTDIDYSPTGAEFVTGSYDKHIRIFRYEFVEKSRSREVYYTSRMNRVFSVLFSADSTFVFSGSDDTNIRMWKAQASVPLRPLQKREKDNLEYANTLKEKFSAFPEINRIAKHKHLPAEAFVAKKKRHMMTLSSKRIEETLAERLPEREREEKEEREKAREERDKKREREREAREKETDDEEEAAEEQGETEGGDDDKEGERTKKKQKTEGKEKEGEKEGEKEKKNEKKGKRGQKRGEKKGEKKRERSKVSKDIASLRPNKIIAVQ